jgi:predicted TIM-barrel fold metal-dependent hydrolase
MAKTSSSRGAAGRLPKRIIDAHNHLWGGGDGTEMIERMDQLGIETALIMGLSRGGSNEDMAKACRKHPGRLIGGAYYNPLDGKKAIDELKRYDEQGLRIVKLFPNLGYFPDQPSVRKFFEAVARRKMGVLSHCGWLGGSGKGMTNKPWASYRATPARFEMLMRLFPDVPFIMAHMGGILGVLESVMLSTRTPNCYIDCSPGQGLWAIEKCGAIAGSIPPEKLLWGADCRPDKPFMERYRKALVKLGYGKDLEKIFYGNARGIFERLGMISSK